jgi:hypothetical protein
VPSRQEAEAAEVVELRSQLSAIEQRLAELEQRTKAAGKANEPQEGRNK